MIYSEDGAPVDAIEKDSLREKNRYEKSSINPCSESVLKSIKMILAVLNEEKTNLERLMICILINTRI